MDSIVGTLLFAAYSILVSAVIAAPVLMWARHRRLVFWHPWELYAALGPGFLWCLLVALGPRVKSLANAIELLTVAVFVGLCVWVRALITPLRQSRAFPITLLVVGLLLAITLYLFVSPLSE